MKKVGIICFAAAAAGGLDVTIYGPFDDQQAAETYGNNLGSDVTWRTVDLVDPIQRAILAGGQPGQQQTAQ